MSAEDESEDLTQADWFDQEVELVKEVANANTPRPIEEYAQAFLDEKGTILTEDNFIETSEAVAVRLVDQTVQPDELDTYQFIIQNYYRGIVAGKRGKTPGPVTQNTHLGADPVSMFNGEFTHEAVDLRINGAGIDFVFKRMYRNQVTFDGPLGVNWDHSYNQHLQESETELVLTTGDLREQRYTRHSTHSYFVPPGGVDAVIEPRGDSFVRRAPNGIRHIFGRIPATPFHHLERIVDRFGNFLQFEYRDDEERLLDHVLVNHTDRVVQFSYDSRNRIDAITDFVGRTWRYTYDDLNDLVAVTTPATDRYTDGLTTCYEYSTASTTGQSQHNLTRIIDAKGQLYLENEFGLSPGQIDFNRVIRQRQGSGETSFEYEDVDPVFEQEYSDVQRPAHQTTMVDRNGHLIHYVYNTFGNLLFKEECISEDGLQRRLTERYRYNRDGQLTASMSPEGVVTQHLYGRGAFLRREGLVGEDEPIITEHQNLTTEERLGFGRLLVTVRRGQYFDFPELNFSQGIWGDVFPDILADPDPEDIILKFTYESTFGQPETISHPGFTNSPDPFVHTVGEGEHPRYQETLTRYTYKPHPDIPDSDPALLLDEIRRPAATRPDGTKAEPVVEKSDIYDEQGRLLRHVNPSGVVTTNTYFNDVNDTREGYLQRTVVDPDGLALTTEYEIDELGQVVATHLPRSVDEPEGHFVTQTEYNELNQATKTIESEPFGFETRRFFDRNGNLEREERDAKDEAGEDLPDAPGVHTFEYDEEFNLIQETTGGSDLSEHLVTRHCYDGAGKRVLTILPEGNQIRYAYDERLLQVAETRGAGTNEASTTRIEYDGDGRVQRIRDGRGNPTTFTLDTSGRTIAEVDALGHVIRNTYDKAGNSTVKRIFEHQDGDTYSLLARTETEYDELNRDIRTGINRFEDPPDPIQGGELKQEFAESPGPGSLLEEKTFYDALGRVEREIDRLERETRIEYDALGRVIVSIDPLFNRVENHYDVHDNLVRRDRRDQVIDSETGGISERIFSNSYIYDTLDRLISQKDSLGNVTDFEYDSRGNQIRRIDPLGNVVRREFDIHNRPVAEIQELTDTGLGGGATVAEAFTRFQYDTNGNVTAVIDALGRQTAFTFDALDRRRAVIYPDGSAFRYEFDADDNLTHTKDNNGLQRHHTVDALGRTTRVDVDESDLTADTQIAGTTFEQYTYDGLDRLVHEENGFARSEIRYNSLNWPIRETIIFTTDDAPLTTPFTISRTFNNVGILTDLVYPSGRQLHFDRDVLDRLTGIHNIVNGAAFPGNPATQDDHDVTSQVEYAGRQRLRCHYGNGATTTYAHDGSGRVIEINHASPNGPLLQIQYLFDAVNNVRVHNDISLDSDLGNSFGYDSIYQISDIMQQDVQAFTPATLAPAPTLFPGPIPDRQTDINDLIGPLSLQEGPHTFSYDLVGNRDNEQTESGKTIEYSRNKLNQYIQRKSENESETYTYDRNGNLKSDNAHRYIYDSLNRLVRVEDVTSGEHIIQFFHDLRGRRIIESVNGETLQLVSDGENLIEEYHNGQLFAQYVHDDGRDRPLQIAAEGEENWYHTDLVGSVRLLTNSDGDEAVSYRYSPFGKSGKEITEQEIYNPFRYTARRFDEILDSYDYRAREYYPTSGRFGQRDPNGMSDGLNLYEYTGNNPLIFADPSGKGREERTPPNSSMFPSRAPPNSPMFPSFDDVEGPYTKMSQGISGLNLTQQMKSWASGAVFRYEPIPDLPWLVPRTPSAEIKAAANLRRAESVMKSWVAKSWLTKGAEITSKGALRYLPFVDFGISSYNLYQDPNPETGADFAASLSSLQGLVLSGAPGLAGATGSLLAAFGAGYGLGKLGDWGIGKVTGHRPSDVGLAVARKKLKPSDYPVTWYTQRVMELNPLSHGENMWLKMKLGGRLPRLSAFTQKEQEVLVRRWRLGDPAERNYMEWKFGWELHELANSLPDDIRPWDPPTVSF